MFIDLDADGKPGKVCVKGDVNGDGEPCEPVLRIQGVVHDMNRTLTGDWDRCV